MLSEEEKKVIERIEDIFYEDIGKGINNFQKITLYEDGILDILKLLNIVEKLQKENELAKEQLKKQCKIADERNNLLVKINKLEKENDLMVEEIRKTILIVKSESRFCQYENDCKNIRCKDCIKQYYEKLAKEKGE